MHIHSYSFVPNPNNPFAPTAPIFVPSQAERLLTKLRSEYSTAVARQAPAAYTEAILAAIHKRQPKIHEGRFAKTCGVFHVVPRYPTGRIDGRPYYGTPEPGDRYRVARNGKPSVLVTIVGIHVATYVDPDTDEPEPADLAITERTLHEGIAIEQSPTVCAIEFVEMLEQAPPVNASYTLDEMNAANSYIVSRIGELKCFKDDVPDVAAVWQRLTACGWN